jgi:signal transduction histidine kinase
LKKFAPPLIGLGLGLLYWVLESAVHSFVLGEGDLALRLFPDDPHEIWTRLLVLALFVALGFGVRFALEQRGRERERLQRTERQAATHERARLSAELHDSVTQTLFASGLIAEALPGLWERDPEEARRRLDEMRRLTRQALAEMRALLLELRPESLHGADLGELLRHLGASMTDRARPEVDVEVKGTFSPPPEVSTAFYRIASEALSNASRHSGASSARVTLRAEPDHVVLDVVDDGSGFEPQDVRPGCFGLGIMRERAGAAGVELDVVSATGQGTRVSATWRGRTA